MKKKVIFGALNAIINQKHIVIPYNMTNQSNKLGNQLAR